MPSDAAIRISRVDEMTLSVPIGSEMNTLRNAATDDGDWRLKSIQTITTGHQRDPLVTGVKLVFERIA